ncbi:hypothetical protein H5410_043049 [Solanum commersonii]|uniref:Protein kinase domain-containing protein n=1 Tax=Solanum commersonii TaxID=4109 RepID=A0A9J5XY53_SOLCO|nr:hypothetical protein H5410_043049 [Solanum commersonii]
MNQWKKLNVIGAGCFGKVYYAVKMDPFSSCAHDVVAVKCADLSRSSSLQQEAQVLTTLKGSPHVVQFFGSDVSLENNILTYNLYLEYASAGSLHHLIVKSKRGILSLPEMQVRYLTYQLLKGIQDVHNTGWVHCDIKPTNVLIFNYAQHGLHLKLSDFGMSSKIAQGMTYTTGTVMSNRGDLPYAPPESLTSGFPGKAYDIWSLGCTVAEMMTGYQVWVYRNNSDLQWNIMYGDPIIPTYVSENARDFLYNYYGTIEEVSRSWCWIFWKMKMYILFRYVFLLLRLNVLIFVVQIQSNKNTNLDNSQWFSLRVQFFGAVVSIDNGRITYMTGATLSNRGTLPYAPESLTSGFHGKAYDIWSLGCTVAEMMTGCHVWIYRDTKDLQWKIMNEDPVISSNYPLRRWTTHQLLQHPFIQQALLCIWMPETHGITSRLSHFQSNLQHCVPNRGLELTAHITDHCTQIFERI